MNLNHTLRSLVLGMPKMLRGRPGERAGEERLAQHRLDLSGVAPLVVMSPAFVKGRDIPVHYTADGVGLSPPLRWGAGPAGTRSWVVWMEDPDAPTPEPFVHWLVADLDAERDSLPEGIPAQGADVAVQGRNSLLRVGYTGCAPPRGDLPHRYHLQVLALDRQLELEPGFGRQELFREVRGHVLALGETVGVYWRPR
jgi:Raf kinase inhibitor-like YbhB/YbcL family protein